MSGEPGAEPAGVDIPSPARHPRLSVQVAQAGRGLLALLGSNAEWPKYFDLTAGGFLRSFFGPALALPLYVFGSALVTRAMLNGQPVPPALLWGAGAAHVMDAISFPVLIALIAKPLRIADGYTAFVVVTNWASLYLNMALLAVSMLVFAGHDGLQVFYLLTLVLLCFSVFFVWRAGRATLSHEIAPVLLVVVLSVAVSAACEEIVQLFV